MVGHIDIHGEIGSRVTLESVKSQINKSATSHIVHISSEGGDVYEGIKIYHELKKLPNVTVVVEGLAASIATLIMQAGQKIIALRPSDIMIHNPWAGMQGDANDFIAAAEQLERIKATLISVYKKRTRMSDSKLAEMMDKETWMNADEAMAAGLIDEVQDRLKAVAKLDLNKFKMENTLSKEDAKTLFEGFFERVQNLFKTVKVKNMAMTLEDGTVVVIDTETSEDLQGKKISLEDGSAAPNGEHKMADGRTIVVQEGVITEVKPAVIEDEMKKEEAEALKAENQRLKDELAKATGAAAQAANDVAATNKAIMEIKAKFEAELKELKNKTFGEPGAPSGTENPNPNPNTGGQVLHPMFEAFAKDAIAVFQDKKLVK